MAFSEVEGATSNCFADCRMLNLGLQLGLGSQRVGVAVGIRVWKGVGLGLELGRFRVGVGIRIGKS